MRRMIAFITALALALSLCACGGSSGADASNAGGSGADQSAADPALDAAPEATPETTPEPATDEPSAPPAPGEATITATDIRADRVANIDGLGYLTIDSNKDQDLNIIAPAQVAVLDRNGGFVIPWLTDTFGSPFQDARLRYSDGIISFTLDSVYATINVTGAVQYFNLDGTSSFTLDSSYTASPIVDGYAVVNQRGDGFRTMIVDKTGAVTCELPQAFNEIESFIGWEKFQTKMHLGWCGEGLFAFGDNVEMKGYMDPAGKTVIDLAGRGYTGLGQFSNGMAYVMSGDSGKYGYIDRTGTLVIPCVYDGASNFYGNGLAAVRSGDKWGFTDRTGKLVVPCDYEGVSGFSSDGLAYAQLDGKRGYIDGTGETVIPFQYDSAYGAGGGLAAVVMDGKCGLVDYDNNVVVPLEYDDISSFEGGVAYAIKDGVVYIIR